MTRYREQSGAAALCGRDLPTDQALSADANVSARAEQYKASGAFPDIRMDQLRSIAFLNLLNSISADQRIAEAKAAAQAASENASAATEDARTAADKARGLATEDSGDVDPAPAAPAAPTASVGRGDDGSVRGSHSWQDDDHPDDGASGPGPDPDRGPHDGSGPGGPGPGSGPDPGDCSGGPGPDHGLDPGSGDHGPGGPGPGLGPGPGGPGPGGAWSNGNWPGAGGLSVRPRPADLVIPLVTLLGLAERPGEGHGLGPLDPDLCRDLALAAAASPHTEWCVTITDAGGIAIGHGCGRPARSSALTGFPEGRDAFPARVNLTITSTQLAALTRTSAPPGARAPAACVFTPRDDPGPPGGYGVWALTLPGTREFVVKLEPVPSFGCDHQRESQAYQPNAMLRHLVQVRDYECTFPTCSRHAHDTDFEHAIPYDKGGRTCGCNAGARSRQCHIVKQSPGWNVTQQPRPGWHHWETPGGRTYTRGPHRYPV